MVSMVVLLLLLALLITLFLGRLAETLAHRYMQRSERRKFHAPSFSPRPKAEDR